MAALSENSLPVIGLHLIQNPLSPTLPLYQNAVFTNLYLASKIALTLTLTLTLALTLTFTLSLPHHQPGSVASEALRLCIGSLTVRDCTEDFALDLKGIYLYTPPIRVTVRVRLDLKGIYLYTPPS